jgi:hypothetical protein
MFIQSLCGTFGYGGEPNCFGESLKKFETLQVSLTITQFGLFIRFHSTFMESLFMCIIHMYQR